MKKKKRNIPEPLRLVGEFENRYPHCYEYCDELVKMKGVAVPNWGNECVIPISATSTIMFNHYIREKSIHKFFTTVLQTLYSWKLYKCIYEYEGEPNIVMDYNEQIPVDTLMKLPYPCIYVNCESIGMSNFFCCVEKDLETNRFELYISFVVNGQLRPYVIPLRNGLTIGRTINSGGNQKFLEACGTAENQEHMKANVFGALQIILSICITLAEKERLDPNRERVGYSEKQADNIINPEREAKWVEQHRIGSIVKKDDEDFLVNTLKNGIQGSPKRPHSRCAHDQHYWVGSKKNGTRHRILKRIAPTFVNGGPDDIITTEHNFY